MSTLIAYALDPMHSRAHFSIQHLAIAHIRGEFTTLSGEAHVDPDDHTQLQINATIDTNSFHSGNEQRDEHVKSAQFLDVASFPSITFISKKSTPGSNGNVEVEGDLTLHGVTKDVTLTIHNVSKEITDPMGSLRAAVAATTKIKRSDFGIDFNAPLQDGGFMLSDDVNIELDLQFVRK